MFKMLLQMVLCTVDYIPNENVLFQKLRFDRHDDL